MRRREQTRFWVYVVGEIMSAAWTVVSLLLDLQGFGTKYDLRLWALIGFVIFVVLVITHLIQQYSIIQGATPRISIFEHPSLVPDQFAFTIREGRKEKDVVVNVLFVRARFSNNPNNRTSNNTGKNVTAQIAYYDKNKNLILGPIFGHWSESGYPENIDINNFLSTDFLSNGVPKSLDLAIKFEDADVFYAFNNENYVYDLNYGWRDESFRLGTSTILMQVKLIGEMVEEEFWFRLFKRRAREIFEIEILKG